MPNSNAARFDELERKLDKLLEMQTATNSLISSLVTRVDSIDKKVEILTGEVHEHSVQLDNQQTSTESLQKNLKQAMEHIDLLENRQRENNLRLLDVPEHSESGMDMIPFLIKIFETEWGVQLKETDIEKAHRLGVRKENARHPRGIIFRVQHFQTKIKLLNAIKQFRSQNADSSKARSKYRIIPDMTVETRRKRDAFWPLRERLHNLNITTKMKHPAVLLVLQGEEELRFKSLQEAESEMNKRFPALTSS